MRVLVTGGCGFIGSAVVRSLVSETEAFVLNIDKLTYAGNEQNVATVSSSDRYLFEKVDICELGEVQRLFEDFQPTHVMHLAAESHVDRSINASDEFIETNIVGTHNLLKVARDHWSKRQETSLSDFRFHHVSTDEVYGDLSPSDDLFTEDTPYAPSSPYSASKAASDHLVRAWYRTYGLPIVITNCSNNYGPYHFPEKLIPLVIINALRGKPLPIYGAGNQIRDWLFVDDHADALILVLKTGIIGETYNIGGHNEKTNLEVVHKICEILQDIRPSESPYQSLIIHVTDRPGHDKRYAINATKIERELGWVPRETFETGIRKTVEWYLENEDWWRQIIGDAAS